MESDLVVLRKKTNTMLTRSLWGSLFVYDWETLNLVHCKSCVSPDLAATSCLLLYFFFFYNTWESLLVVLKNQYAIGTCSGLAGTKRIKNARTWEH